MTRLNARTWALDTAFNESLTFIIKMWQAQPSAAGASMLCIATGYIVCETLATQGLSPQNSNNNRDLLAAMSIAHTYLPEILDRPHKLVI
jgi:hypothetical protein